MADLGQVTIVGAITSSDYVLVVIDGKAKRVPASQFFAENGYQGIAALTTNPSTPSRGDWYYCDEDGTYTNFGAQAATKNDRFYYNGTSWDLIAFTNLIEAGYKGVKQPADAAIANPENSWWVRCGTGGTFTNYSGLVCNAGDILAYNSAIGAWEKELGNTGLYILGQDLDADGNKIVGLADGNDELDAVNFRQAALKSDIYDLSDVSNILSSTDSQNSAPGVISAINDVPVTQNGFLHKITAKFASTGECKFVILRDKVFSSGVSYRFTIVYEFTLIITEIGLQTIDLRSLNIAVETNDYIGIQRSSTTTPVYGTDATKGYGWYQVTAEITSGLAIAYVANAGFAFSYYVYNDIYTKKTDIYLKTETDALLSDKADKVDLYEYTLSGELKSKAATTPVLLANDIPSPATGRVSQLTVNSSASGTATFQVIKRNTFNSYPPSASQTDSFSLVSSFEIDLIEGINTYILSEDVQILSGQYIAWVAGSVQVSYGSSGDGGWWQGSGSAMTGTSTLTYQPIPVCFNFTVETDKYEQAATEVVINKITATRNIDDYNSIRDIITAITDATEFNRYEIYIPNGEWFEVDIRGKDWITLIGESRDGTILYCDSTLTDAKYIAPSDYSYASEIGKQLNAINKIFIHVVFPVGDMTFKDMTFKQTRGKYAVHIDNLLYSEINFDNCRFYENDCNYPIGIGINGGQKLTFTSCIIERVKTTTIAQRLGFFFHNWNNQSEKSTTTFQDCKFLKCGYGMIDELGSDQMDQLNVINCESDSIGQFEFMVDITSGNVTYWTNPATGSREPDPKEVPYCIQLNASGTRVDLITSSLASNFPSPYDIGEQRPNAIEHTICDYWGIAIIPTAQTIVKGDILSFGSLTDGNGNTPKATKFTSLSSNAPLLGVALENGTGVVNDSIMYAPIGKYAPTLVNGSVLANSINKKLIWDDINKYLEADPTADIRTIFAFAYEVKASGYSTVITKIL